jgi:3',5'-cyclic AMP phosphodiesterase CpdA
MILILMGSCLYLQYSPERISSSFALNEKCRDIEGYLDLFEDVESEGIFTHPGFNEITDEKGYPDTPSAVLDFIHLSDVQLRDERAQLFSRLWSGVADSFVDSVRFEEDQEKYDFAVFKCLLLGVNEYTQNEEENRPAFLIHTGDSVHVSLLSEAWEFLYIMSQTLDATPWFNAVGNHDVTVFGTPVLSPNAYFRNPSLSFLPVNSPSGSDVFDASTFMSLHGSDETLVSGIPMLGPARGVQDLDDYWPGAFDPAQTYFHGFDMLPSQVRRDRAVNKNTKKSGPNGYYAFDYTLVQDKDTQGFPEKVRVVVLNTSEYVSTLAEGGFSLSQIRWLRELLQGLPNEKMRAVVFGHHPLIPKKGWMKKRGEQYRRLKQVHDLLEKHADVYFCGHSHRQGYSDEFGFLQVIAPSVIDFPQSGHKVRMMYSSDSLCVEIVPFSHAEMQHDDLLSQNLDHIIQIWENDSDILQAVEEIVRTWEADPHLITRDINHIASLWENSVVVKNILDRAVASYGKYEEIKLAVRKAALLKQAYLARTAALEDASADDYFHLGQNYRFVIPFE